jgi:hypothetical protein
VIGCSFAIIPSPIYTNHDQMAVKESSKLNGPEAE